MPCPQKGSNISAFNRVPKTHRVGDRISEILSTTASELRTRDIHELFQLLEERITTWAPKTRYELSTQIRRVFRNCQEPLADGKLIAEVGYSSIHHAPKGPRRDWKPIEINNKTNPILHSSLSRIEFNDLDDRQEAALSHLISIQNIIIDKCVSALDSHQRLAQEFIYMKKDGLKGLPATIAKTLKSGKNPKRQNIARLKPKQRLRVSLYLVERDYLYRQTPKETLLLRGVSTLSPMVMTASAEWRLDALLSDYFLPRVAVTACAIVLAVETGWNIETLFSINAADVIETETGYLLLGIKSRTKRRQAASIGLDGKTDTDSPKVDETENGDRDVQTPVGVRVVKLLMTNNARITHFLSLKRPPPLLAALRLHNGGAHIFELYKANEALKNFASKFHLPPIIYGDLRHLYAHIKYLSPNGNIFFVNALLGHADLATTSIYVDSTITKSLQDANILRYMRKLSASILWVCGREDVIIKKNIDRKYIDQNLLFPVSSMQAEATDCLIDSWIAANGESQLLIGEQEIQHCCRQYLYYLSHFDELISANMERFVRFHLPRIVACLAPRRVILASRHRSIYTEFEEGLNVTLFAGREGDAP